MCIGRCVFFGPESEPLFFNLQGFNRISNSVVFLFEQVWQLLLVEFCNAFRNVMPQYEIMKLLLDRRVAEKNNVPASLNTFGAYDRWGSEGDMRSALTP